jgi:hypothetical protein
MVRATSCFLTWLVIGALAGGGGCKSTEDACQEANCRLGQQLYSCKPTTGFRQYQCHDGEVAAAFWCQSIAGKPAVHIVCDGAADEVGDGDGDRGASEVAPAVRPREAAASTASVEKNHP